MEFIETKETASSNDKTSNKGQNPLNGGQVQTKLPAQSPALETLPKKKRKVSFNQWPDKVQQSIKEGFRITSPISNVSKLNIPEFKLESQLSGSKSDQTKTFVLGVVGGANSGKTIFTECLKNKFEEQGITVSVLKEKNFLKKIDGMIDLDKIPEGERLENILNGYDFDCLSALDDKLLQEGIKTLKEGKTFDSPIFNYSCEAKFEQTLKVKVSKVLIIEGRLLLYLESIRNLIDVSIFLETDLDIMLSRRVFKEIARGFKIDEITARYLKFVKPAQETLVEPTKKYADITLTNYSGENHTAENSEKTFEKSNVMSMIPGLFMFWEKQGKVKKTVVADA